MEKRSSWEIELEDQLRRTAAAHSEHLEQVIRTQRQLFEIEHNQKVEEVIYACLFLLHPSTGVIFYILLHFTCRRLDLNAISTVVRLVQL